MGAHTGIVVADESPTFCRGLVAVLDAEVDLTVVGHTTEIADLARLVGELAPNVVVSGLERPAAIDVVASAAGTPVLLLAPTVDPQVVAEAVQARADGLVGKRDDAADIVAAVRALASGRSIYPAGWQIDLVDRGLRIPQRTSAIESLTPRERLILDHLMDGASNKEIARVLGLAQQTVKNQLGHLMLKVGVSSRLQLFRWGMQNGIRPSGFDIDLRELPAAEGRVASRPA
jgi:DNA-binding NarL/FixJ family response regulator